MHQFPNELKQAVLVETAALCGLDSLLSLASTSHIYHDLYQSNEKALLAHALSAIPQPVLTIIFTLAITPTSKATKHERLRFLEILPKTEFNPLSREVLATLSVPFEKYVLQLYRRLQTFTILLHEQMCDCRQTGGACRNVSTEVSLTAPVALYLLRQRLSKLERIQPLAQRTAEGKKIQYTEDEREVRYREYMDREWEINALRRDVRGWVEQFAERLEGRWKCEPSADRADIPSEAWEKVDKLWSVVLRGGSPELARAEERVVGFDFIN